MEEIFKITDSSGNTGPKRDCNWFATATHSAPGGGDLCAEDLVVDKMAKSQQKEVGDVLKANLSGRSWGDLIPAHFLAQQGE
jgi:hypothetical protein